jgi:hypothetical protein
MKRHMRCELVAAAALCLLYPALTLNAQTMSHEEESVRNAYAKLSLLCSAETATEVAREQDRGISADPQQFNARINKEVPTFTLSDFETGSVTSIADRPWGDFVTPGSSLPERLAIGGKGHTYTEYGNPPRTVRWNTQRATWTNVSHSVSAEAAMMARTVSQVVAIGTPYWSGKSNPVTYTRYAAFTVDVSLDGQSTGPHKALWLFGTDSHGKEFVAENDLISGTGTKLSSILAAPMYPAGLLQTKLRENPNVSTWLRSNEMPAASCGPANQTDLCCAKGRCGISPADFNHDMSTPLPPTGGLQ